VNERTLEPFRRSPGTAGLFLDFDGTLSEIVPVAADARPVEGMPELLGKLTGRFALVAVVSGRSARELAEWLGEGVEIWGVHGAERALGGRVAVSEAAAAYGELMDSVKEEARARVNGLGIPGTFVEDKGAVIALHFRAAAEREAAGAALDEIAADLATRHGLVRAEGRLAFELRPPIELSKAQIVRRRAREERLEAAMFVGDDRVDLPAFDALDELEEAGVATSRVAVASDEAPEELIARADLVVDGPAGVAQLLHDLSS
jgi:trehalose 6-phosphate phosphatase